MDGVLLPRACLLCGQPGSARCARCERMLCDRHAPAAGEAGCAACVHERRLWHRGRHRSHLALRVVAVGGAAVGGMVGGAVLLMLLAGFVGIAPELLVLLMLLTELACGGLAAWIMDRRMDRWVDARMRAALEGHVPEARLLRGGKRDGGPGGPETV